MCNKLTEAGVNQGAIEDILLTFVISPLLERYLPEALDEALSEYSWSQLPQPTDELLKELLKAFKELALNAGKAALLERLSPIVNTCVRASSARVAHGPALDEEQALMQPKESAACLVQELWPALRASLEAQARRPSQYTHHSTASPYYHVTQAHHAIYR